MEKQEIFIKIIKVHTVFTCVMAMLCFGLFIQVQSVYSDFKKQVAISKVREIPVHPPSFKPSPGREIPVRPE